MEFDNEAHVGVGMIIGEIAKDLSDLGELLDTNDELIKTDVEFDSRKDLKKILEQIDQIRKGKTKESRNGTSRED